MIEPKKLYRFALSLSDFHPVTKHWATMDLELCPRIGEAILDFQNEDAVQAYRVVDIVHWSCPKASEFAGMLIVERLETTPHWLAVESSVQTPEPTSRGSFQRKVR